MDRSVKSLLGHGAVSLVLLVAMVASVLVVSPGHAGGDPPPPLAWAAALGGPHLGRGHQVAVDGSGNVYTTGRFNETADFDPGPGVFNLTSAGSSDVFVSKLDSAGNFVWAKAMGGTRFDEGFGVAVDGSGNVYTTGFFLGPADFDPGPGVFNLTGGGGFVWKLDSAGDFVWAKQMGGSGAGVAVDGSDNVYISGSFAGTADFDPGPGVSNLTSVGGSDVFVSKLDGAGSFLWAAGTGGTDDDGAGGVAVDGSGNVYTTGEFRWTADFDPGPEVFNLSAVLGWDVFVWKLGGTGNLVWATAMGGTAFDEGSGVAVDGSGNAYTSGHSDDGGAFVWKLDSAGTLAWAAGGVGNQGRGVALDGTGNVYTTGFFSGTADFDPGPGVFNLTSAGFRDVFVWKLDGTGNLVWAAAVGGTDDDQGFGVAVDGSGSVYTTGHFQGTADLDPGPGVFNLTSAGQGAFVSKWVPDVTAPVVTVTTPAEAATFDRAEVVLADYSCVDEAGGSGLLSCVGDVADGAAIDTGTVGAHTFTVTGTDVAGNEAVVVHNYTVEAPAQVCNGLSVTVDLNMGDSPTGGDDVVLGTPLGDIINTLGGNDTVCAGGGNDVVNGGPGNDVVHGDAGADTLKGGDGADRLEGGSGADTLKGQAGNDVLNGQGGGDSLSGGAGADLLNGGGGGDTMLGGTDADRLNGNSGDDQLFGLGGDDRLNGGVGDDFANGGAGNDVVKGQGGDDQLKGASGEDVLDGGSGVDTLNGGGDDDNLRGSLDADTVRGNAGDDTLLGQAGDDELIGGIGADFMLGAGGDDTLFGQGGGDDLRGGPGSDDLRGGPGTDTCKGNTGVDTTTGCEITSGIP